MKPSCRNPCSFEYIAAPALQDNYIWIIADGRHAVVVDPGDAQPVNAQLSASGWRLSAILLTHHHRDHIGGVADLLREHDAPVYGPAREAIDVVTHPLQGGDAVRLSAPQLTFTALDIPGHTRGHIAFFQDQKRAGSPRVFCGDTLFACGCGRLFEGEPRQMLASLDLLASLPEATRVHCAHEYTLSNIRFALACDPDNLELHAWQRAAQALRARGEPTLPTTIAQEKRINPFLRAAEPVIQQRLACSLGVRISGRLATFTAMRAWKDRFY